MEKYIFLLIISVTLFVTDHASAMDQDINKENKTILKTLSLNKHAINENILGNFVHLPPECYRLILSYLDRRERNRSCFVCKKFLDIVDGIGYGTINYMKISLCPTDFDLPMWMLESFINRRLYNLRTLNLTIEGKLGEKIGHILAKNTTITSLFLTSSKIEHRAIQALVKNTTLTSLHLFRDESANKGIGNKGAQALAKNTTLRTLSLFRQDVGNKGAQALAKMSLTDLCLDSNRVKDKGAKALAKNTTLTPCASFS